MLRFTPKHESSKVVCIRVSCEKLKVVDALATKYNMSRNKFICQCLDFALENRHLMNDYLK